MNTRLLRSLTRLGGALVLAVTAVFALRPTVRATHRAHLSFDLLTHDASLSTTRKRVILTGDPMQIADVAARHQLQIVRLLANGAVLSASSTELTDLAADVDVPSVSGDVPVHTWMSVSNSASAADQVRAGSSGLLGIGGMAGVNGQGVGVAGNGSRGQPHPPLENPNAAEGSL